MWQLAANSVGISTPELVAAIAGGSSLGALITAIFAGSKEWLTARHQRKGRARLVHEDLYRLQSTVTRMYYAKQQDDWEERWALPELASREAQQDVLSALTDPELRWLSSGLGWGQYLRSSEWPAGIDDDPIELWKHYEAFARGRLALHRWMPSPYRPHEPDHIVEPNQADTNRKPLERIDEARLRKGSL